jgi:hypothetical protein
MGVTRKIASRIAGVWLRSTIGELTGPGETALTVTPNGASSTAQVCMKLMTPPFEAQ